MRGGWAGWIRVRLRPPEARGAALGALSPSRGVGGLCILAKTVDLVVAGVVAEVLVAATALVERGQPLFRVGREGDGRCRARCARGVEGGGRGAFAGGDGRGARPDGRDLPPPPAVGRAGVRRGAARASPAASSAWSRS